MRIKICIAVAALICSGIGQSASAQNQFSNPGFEAPITFDGPPFVGSWEGFSSGGPASSGNLSITPRTGLQHLGLSITSQVNAFAGAFQDVAGLTAGSLVTFSGWHMTTSNPLDLGIEFRIEWRNSVSNTEINRTPNMTTIPTGAYTEFSLNSVVPAGADTARCVYAIQTFGGGPTHNGVVYVDDASFVPAPTTFALAMGGMGMVGLRRRRA